MHKNQVPLFVKYVPRQRNGSRIGTTISSYIILKTRLTTICFQVKQLGFSKLVRHRSFIRAATHSIKMALLRSKNLFTFTNTWRKTNLEARRTEEPQQVKEVHQELLETETHYRWKKRRATTTSCSKLPRQKS
jgi:hypothetical protein